MDFLALDVETANPNLASICQVGLVEFANGELVKSSVWVVDPEDYFAGINVRIHGIRGENVKGQPTWPLIQQELRQLLQSRTVVSHTAFDRTSLRRASQKYQLEPVACNWLDSAAVARRAWPEFSPTGYGLSALAARFGISFTHHNAQEDARAAGEILIRAIRHSGVSLSEWIARTGYSTALSGVAHPQESLAGDVVVFTGALSITRIEAADLAAQAGCTVATTVSKATTVLVVGDQDVSRLGGHDKSSKHRKAEELIANGQPIRILGESDFRAVLSPTS